jgi:ribonuclease HI
VSKQAQFIAYFDGACEPRNPGGNIGFGAVIYRDGATVWTASGMFPAARDHSNNVAEYMAFIAILNEQRAKGRAGARIEIRGDSKLVINQMFGTWRIKGGLYASHARQAKSLLRHFPQARGVWIPRRQNSVADDLSKAELRKAGVQFRIQPEGRGRHAEQLSREYAPYINPEHDLTFHPDSLTPVIWDT